MHAPKLRRLALALLFALGAHAHDAMAGAPTPDQVERANKAFAKAAKALKQKNYKEAEPFLVEAFALNPTYDLANDLGFAECKLGKTVKCVEHLSFALANWPLVEPKGGAAARSSSDALLKSTRKQVGGVIITSSRPGASVALDDKPLGAARLGEELFVEPGKHTVTATLDHYVNFNKTVDVAAGGTEKVSIELVADAPVPLATGTPTGDASATVPPPTSGSSNPPPPPRSMGPAVLVGATGVAAMGVGAVMIAVGSGKGKDGNAIADRISGRHNNCVPGGRSYDAECGAMFEADQAGDRFNRVGIGLMIGGGVAGAAALVYALTGSSSDGKTGFVVVPAAGPRQAGLLMRGSF
jgi:hypothetical protein